MLYFNRGIPQEAHDVMGQFAAAGIAVFAVTHTGGWVLIARDGRLLRARIPTSASRNRRVPQGRRHVSRRRVHARRRLGVVTNKHYFARGIPDECFQKIGEFWNKGWQITSIAFPPAGGNSWLILAGGALFARGVPRNCSSGSATTSRAGAPRAPWAFPRPAVTRGRW